MQVTETKSEGLKRAYAAKATAAEIEARIDAKLEEVRPTAQLKGFRKGKAPLSLLKKMFGKSMLGEAMQEMVDEAVKSHLEENDHRPAQRPEIKIVNETFEEGDDLDVEFSYELLPDIPELAFGEIKLERLTVEVADEDVDKALNNLAENAKSFEDAKDGAAEEGAQAVIDFIGRIDGEAFEGGAADDFPLVLGSNQFIPGFEEQLVGASAGEEREVKVAFPENYGAETLAGKEAVFSVTVKEVRSPKVAEIDDGLAERYGAESLEAMKNQIRDQIANEYRSAARSHLKRKLLDALSERLDFELPEMMLEQEAKQIADQLWHDDHPEVEGHDHDEIEATDEHRRLASRRVRLGLLFSDVGEKASIEVTEAELNQAAVAAARRYPGREKEFFDAVQKSPQLRQQFAAPIYEDKVVDYIIELADVSEKPVTADELRAALAELDDDDKPAEAASAAVEEQPA